MIKMSAGTAHILGIRKLAIDALPTTAYLMSGEKCIHDCAFCPQARKSSARADLLSRVTWSPGEVSAVAGGVGAAFRSGQLKRACLQVVDGNDILAEVRETVKEIKKHSEVPVCVSAKVKTVAEVQALAAAGADRIGLALDAASERIYNTVKTGSWQETLALLEKSAQALPGRISTHLIAGLGETEEEMTGMLQHMWDLGVTVGLFAFTPVPGTRMADASPPDLDRYRRMQAANYLIGRGLVNAAACSFAAGRLVGYGLSTGRLSEYLKDGRAFETSGCPDCNRPYYNEKPGGVIYNYPRPLSSQEAAEALNTVIRSITAGEVS